MPICLEVTSILWSLTYICWNKFYLRWCIQYAGKVMKLLLIGSTIRHLPIDFGPSLNTLLYLQFYEDFSANYVSWWTGHRMNNIASRRRFNIVGCCNNYPASKVHGANMGPTWVLSAPDGPNVGPMNVAIRVVQYNMIMNTALQWPRYHIFRVCTHNICHPHGRAIECILR